ncbi:MAG: hypothetical protein R3B70_06020 [Polyangiaceae bacterium]
MAYFTDSSGEIEIISVSSASVGDRVKLVFKPIDEPNPPYTLSVTSPTGSSIVDTVLRALPTGEPQSAPPFEFSPSVPGLYRVRIAEMRGRAYGEGKLKIV